jgi:hypothetical protein
VPPHEGVVDAAGATGLAGHLVPPPGGEQPFVQPFAGVAERCIEALTSPVPKPSSEIQKCWTRVNDTADAPFRSQGVSSRR